MLPNNSDFERQKINRNTEIYQEVDEGLEEDFIGPKQFSSPVMRASVFEQSINTYFTGWDLHWNAATTTNIQGQLIVNTLHDSFAGVRYSIDQNSSRIGTLNGNVNNAFSRIARTENDVKGLYNSNNLKTSQINSLINSVSSINLKNSTQDDQISNLSSGIRSHSTAIANINNKNATQDTQISNLSTAVSQHTNSITSLQNRMSAVESLSQSLLQVVTEMNNRSKDSVALILGISKKIDNLDLRLGNILDNIKLLDERVKSSLDIQNLIAGRLKDMSNVMVADSGKLDKLIENSSSMLDQQKLLDVRIKGLGDLQTLISNRLKDMTNVMVADSGKLDKLIENSSSMLDQQKLLDVRIKGLGELQTLISNRLKDMTNVMVADSGKFDVLNNTTKSILDNVKLSDERLKEIILNVKGMDDLKKVMEDTRDYSKSSMLINKDVSLFSGFMNDKLKDIKSAVESIDKKIIPFSDVAMIAAINNFKNIFNADNADKKGTFLAFIKEQFDAVISSTNAISSNLKTFNKDFLFNMDSYFGTTGDADSPNGRFSKYLYDLNYRLRYSLIGQTDEIIEWQGIMSKNLETSVKYSDVISSRLNTANSWLEIISKKPTATIPPITVTVPPFDFVKLEQILKSLDFGTGGESGWLKQLIKTIGDVLVSAIETLGDLLETGLKGVLDALNKILDFIDKIFDFLVRLIIPENLDFAKNKNEATANTIKMKFKFIFDGVDSIKGLLGNQTKFEDIPLNINAFNFTGNVNLPISVINDFAPPAKIVITGFILLEFLIDMYKWFHTRGEIIE